MRKINKAIISIVFVISSFIFINSVKADYNATVVNPANAKCNVSKTHGMCFYENTNLNTVGYINSLDSGDEVTVRTSYNNVNSPNKNLCSDYYVYATYHADNNKDYSGYYCNAYLKTGSVLTESLKNEFRNAGFPESYWEKLAVLKTSHPNWSFKAINTGLDFNTAVVNQNYAGKALLRASMSNNYALLDQDTYSFDYYNDRFVPRDDTTGRDPWYDVNKETIAYYLDPRNFLIDMYIFQFEGLSYDGSISDDSYRQVVTSIFNRDYLANFINEFVRAGKESKVSPVYLASLSKQEVGVGENPNTATAGTYNGMYNFYNIGATGGENPVLRGLQFAANTDASTERPWNTHYKAIYGGALWIGKNYINVGQDTCYFKKWNVVANYLMSQGKPVTWNNYSHQYMTCINAPVTEAKTSYNSIFKTGLIENGYRFYIPVYNNMPSSTSLPTKSGWPNNYLKSLTINGTKVADFDGANEEYNYYLDVNNNTVNIQAAAISSKANISGTGTFTVDENTTKNVVVTAENGNKKTYKINIKLTGNKIIESINLQTTMNNSGIKNNDKYLSGLTPGMDISGIKTKILNAKSDAIVTLKNSSGTIKNSGTVVTGDKISVVVGSEGREYQVIIYGDANGDGEINAIDYVKIRKYIMKTSSLSGSYMEAADVNKDGLVDSLDYVKIRKYIMNTSNIVQ